MPKLFLLSTLIISCCISVSTAIADPAEGLCDELKGKDVTKGLFGLCVAFHNAGEDRGSLLEKYNERKNENDPSMPMDGECACWSMEQLTADLGNPMFCLYPSANYPWDAAVFTKAQFLVGDLYRDGTLACGYKNVQILISESIADQCAQDIAALEAVYFPGGCF